MFNDCFREYEIKGGGGVGQADLTISNARIGRVDSSPQGGEKPGVLGRPEFDRIEQVEAVGVISKIAELVDA
jgi:hypothetical protein